MKIRSFLLTPEEEKVYDEKTQKLRKRNLKFALAFVVGIAAVVFYVLLLSAK